MLCAKLSGDAVISRFGREDCRSAKDGDYAEKVLRWSDIAEVFWKCADLTGQELITAGPSKGEMSKFETNLAYLRLTPMDEAALCEWQSEQPSAETKRLIASHDGGKSGQWGVSASEDFLAESECMPRLPLDLGDGLRMAFGGEGKPHWVKRFTWGQFLQASHLEYRVERDGDLFGSGEKTHGWGSRSGDRGSVEVAVRDMWQEYPKGIAIGREGIDVQNWPSTCGETLKFSTPWKEIAVCFSGTRDEAEFKGLVEEKPTAPLNLKSTNAVTREELLWVEEMVAKYAPDRPASYNDTGTDNGFGAAKTTEFVLLLSVEAISDEAAEILGICVQEPVTASADVSCTCATGAMRMVAPFDPERFPEAEQELDNLFERIVVEPRQVLRT